MTTPTNNKDFNDILHRCIQAVERGQVTVEACVAQFPEYPELRDLLTLALAMREMPRPMMAAAFTAKTQQRLAAQLKAQTARRSSTAQRRLWKRLAAVFGVLAILLFVSGGYGLRRASAAALPGESLYPVKRTFERADVIFSGITGDRVTVLYHVAQERLKEVDGLSLRRQPIEAPVLTDMAHSFQEAYIEQPDQAKRDLEVQAVRVFRKAQAQGVISPEVATRTLGDMAISPTVFNQPPDVQNVTATPNAAVVNSPTLTSTPTATATHTPTHTATLTPTFTLTSTPQPASPITATAANTINSLATQPVTSAATQPPTTAAPSPTVTQTPQPQNPTILPTSTVPTATNTATNNPAGVQPFTTAQVLTNVPPTAIPTTIPPTVPATTAAPTVSATAATPDGTASTPATVEATTGTVTVTADSSGTVVADLPTTPADDQTAAPIVSATGLSTDEATATITLTPTITRTPTRTPTFTRTPRPTRTPTRTPTPTFTPTATDTPTMTYTPSETPPPTQLPTQSPDAFNGCPLDGNGGNAALNRQRNRTDDGSYQPKSLDDLLAENAPGLGDGQAVTIEGIAVLAQQSGPEPANCNSPGDVTWRVWIAAQPGQLPKSVVVGITPRIRAKHPGWTLEKLSAIVAAGGRVQISGWLLRDPEHADDVGKTRGTLWEVHPAMQIAVQKDGAWVSLDDYQP